MQQNYSVLKATTGSFFAALLAGISPEISVKRTLTIMSVIALFIGRDAIEGYPIIGLRMRFTMKEIT